jgi:hypothetical protein
MNTTHNELLERYLAGQTTQEESAAFESALKLDPALRALYLDHLNLETALEAQAGAVYGLLDSAVEAPAKTIRGSWVQPRQLVSAAAGLVLGLFSASMVFGYVLPMTSKAITLLSEGFEAGPAPRVVGMPLTPGVWSGDFTEVVSAQQGVTPEGGKKMLRFLRADYAGKPAKLSYSGDLYRLIDIRPHAADLRDGNALVTFVANVRTTPCPEPKRFHCGLGVYALDALPEATNVTVQPGALPLFGSGADWSLGKNLATTVRQFPLNSEGGSWQKFRVELRIPNGAQYLMLAVHLLDQSATKATATDAVAEFSGQFMDNVEVTLLRKAPLQ